MERRITTLLNKMKALNLDAILVGSKANRMYLSGFTGSSAMLYISEKKQVIITDFRYMEQVSIQCPNFESLNQGTLGLIGSALKIAQEEGAKRIGFESEHTVYSTYLELAKNTEFEFVPTDKLIEEARQIKDEEELKKLTEAERIGDLAFEGIVPFIEAKWRNGLTENDIALELERIMRKNGASGTSFDSIVAGGAKSSLPHAVPGDVTLKEGDFVVMDFGCIYEGYCSDMTRTILIGEPTNKHLEIYNTVLKAQKAALEQIKPGMTGQEVDKIARDIITAAGYGDCFGHGLGHGVGIDIHESPRFSPAEKAVIKAGMVMTVEPGIYVPGFGGVRIEDMVIVTENGILNVTHSPKELIIIK
nr:aminopeptidase P family protein [uncultured Cellulosilyticum sp.]